MNKKSGQIVVWAMCGAMALSAVGVSPGSKPPAVAAQGSDSEQTRIDIYEKASPAVVTIVTEIVNWGKKEEAIRDLETAARLFQAQNNPDDYQRAMQLIRQIKG